LGFFTRKNRFHRFLEERRGRTFDDDESYAPRIVNPEYEASGDPQMLSYVRPPSCDASIQDEMAMSNGKASPFANGYSKGIDKANGTEFAIYQTDNNSRSSAHVMEYTDSDIITTTSSEKLPNTEPRETSPAISACSKETEV